MHGHDNRHNPRLTPVSQKLRKTMTSQEKRLWYQFLRNLSVPIHRQKIFDNYIVDFYCHEAKLVIELDGSQHFEQEGRAGDAKRDAYFDEMGIAVVRYSNADVNRYFRAVCEDIMNRIEARSGKRPQFANQERPHPSPVGATFPQGEGIASLHIPQTPSPQGKVPAERGDEAYFLSQQ